MRISLQLFIKQSLQAIRRLNSGKGVLESPQERLADIYRNSIPNSVLKLAASVEVEGISLDLPKGKFLVDTRFIEKEAAVIKNLKSKTVDFPGLYSKMLFVLLEKGTSPWRNDHFLDDKSKDVHSIFSKNLLGYKSILVAPYEALIQKPKKYQPVILIYKKEDDILYLANIGLHNFTYDELDREEFNFVSPIGY